MSDGSFTMESEDGTMSTQYGSGAKIPAGWPPEFPQYPGSNVIASHSTGDDEGRMMGVSMTTKDAPEQVIQYYEDKAASAGYKQTSTYTANEMVNNQYSGPELLFVITVSREDNETSIGLAVQPNPQAGKTDDSAAAGGDSGEAEGEASAGGGTEASGGAADGGTAVVSDGSGGLPEGFPVQVLKPYVNGTVTVASMSGADSMLVQETADSPAQVVEFYDNHLTGRGWSIETKMEMQGSTMRSYKSSGGNIVLTVGDNNGTTQISLNYSASK